MQVDQGFDEGRFVDVGRGRAGENLGSGMRNWNARQRGRAGTQGCQGAERWAGEGGARLGAGGEGDEAGGEDEIGVVGGGLRDRNEDDGRIGR